MSREDQFVLASDENTQPETLLLLANIAEYQVCYAVAQNPSTPPEALMTLAENVSTIVRKSVAQNQNTPSNTLLKLSEDDYYEVPFYVAQNPNTPSDALLKLANDDDVVIRRSVARNPNIPIFILKLLACDSYLDVVTPVIKNRLVTQEILQNIYVRLVNQDKLTDMLAIELLLHNLQLGQTELSALVAFYEHQVGEAIAKSGQVVKNSTLDKQLLQLGLSSVYQNAEQQKRELAF